MKKILAITICIVMLISSAFAVAAYAEEDSAAQFYQSLEEIITAANTQDARNTDGDRPENFPALSEPAFLYRSDDVVFSLDGQELNAENGIILQMIDDDTGISEDEMNDSGLLLEETPGFLTEAYTDYAVYELTQDTAVDPEKTYYVMTPETEEGYSEVEEPTDGSLSSYYEKNTGNCSVVLNITHGEYEGDIYNATGYYSQAPDYLEVNIGTGAVLTGDIALASCVHGMMTAGLDMDDMISLLEERQATAQDQKELSTEVITQPEPAYVLLDADGNVTDEKEAAVAVQFTKIYAGENFLLGKVVNSLNYNKASCINVSVQGSWTIRSASLITGLHVEENALVYGEIIELADGSLMIIPSEETIGPGQYGAAKE